MADAIRSCGANMTNAISSVANTTPVLVTLSANHKFAAGEWVKVGGTGISAIDTGGVGGGGSWQIQDVPAANQIRLQGSTASGTSSSGNVGRYYNKAQLSQWTGITGDLFGNRYILELYDDDGLPFDVDAATRLQITGATGLSATVYRILRAGSGVSAFTGKPHRFNPYTQKGVRIRKALTATANFGNGIELSEQYAKIQGIGIVASSVSPPSSGTCSGLIIDAANCQADAVFVLWDQGTGTFSGRGFWIKNTGATAQLTNVIAQGSGDATRGAHTGIHDDSGSSKIYVSAAYANAFGATPRGIVAAGSTEIQDCISIGHAFGDFIKGGTFSRNISSDTSATFYGDAAGQDLKTATQLWPYAALSDFRCLDTSPARAVGLPLTWTFAGDATPKDFAGVVRTSPWNVGPYEGSTPNPFASNPTEVVTQVADLAALTAWETATRQDLIYGDSPYGNTIQVAELADAVFAFSSGTPFTVGGARTDSKRYRIVRAAAGARYDPLSAIGVRITGNVTNAQGRGLVHVSENYSRVQGLFVDNQNSGTSTDAAAVALTGTGTRADACFGQVLLGNGANRAVFLADTLDDEVFSNCIALGSGSTTAGATFGFLIATAADRAKLLNCVAYNFDLTTFSAFGFKVNGTLSIVKNCIGAGSRVDFSVPGDATFESCSSADSTANGPFCLTGIAHGQVFNSPSRNDFRLKPGSPADNAGEALWSEFTTDFSGAQRSAPWEMGAFNGVAFYIAGKAVQPGQSMRLCTCWKIERLDGVALYLTDHDCELVFEGQVWSPIGAASASARREEAGLRDSNLEIHGAIESDAITEDDLRARRYEGATVTEYVGVDWRFPWASPQLQVRRWIETQERTGEVWKASIVGLSHRMQQKQGEVVTRVCRAKLFDSKCRRAPVDVQAGVAVTQVDSARTTFRASSISGTHADQRFQLGYFIWLTGANAGIESEVLFYTQTGRIVELVDRMPFDIEVGDTFTMHPGCDGRYPTCRDTYANTDNFQAEPYAPGTDRLLATPQS